MDVNTLRIAITVIAFLSFLAIVAWAWSGARRSRFAEAALLPFDEGELEARTPQPGRGHGTLK